LIPVASYVCVINDITDEAQDRAAGKRNRLAGVPVWADHCGLITAASENCLG
jgi:hypothetical protein